MGRALGAAAVLAVGAAPLAAAPALAQPPAVSAPPAARPAPPTLGSTSAILVNLQSRRVLYAKDVHAHLPPASLTKIVTALVVRDRFKLDDPVTVTDEAARVRGETIGLEPGMRFTVHELLYAMLLLSANDAAAALAAHDPLGTTGFVAQMNRKAKQLGAFDSNFMNPHGLDEPGHVSSAWDMATFARQLLGDPELAAIVGTRTYPMPWKEGAQRVIQNHNKLLWRYGGAIGVKTGYTNQAGKCLVAAARTGAGTALTVVLHSPDHYRETTALLDYFTTRPAGVVPAQALSTPRPAPRPKAEPAVRPALKAVAPVAVGGARYRWLVLPMALLAGSMLLTLRRPRRRHPLAEAAELHPYLEPLASDEAPR